jgi:phage shock protein C
MNTTNRLMRSSSDKVISGVCGGLAEYFGIDSTIVRLIFVVAVLSGVSPLLYIVLWIVMPQNKVVAQVSYPQPAPQLQSAPTNPAPAPSAQTVVRSQSFYEGQENWQYDPITGEKIERQA